MDSSMIQKLKKNLIKLRDIKKKDMIGESLLPMLVDNNLEAHTFNIPQFKKSFGCSEGEESVSEGLTYKFLENTFKKFFGEEGENCDKTKELLEFVKTHRRKQLSVY